MAINPKVLNVRQMSLRKGKKWAAWQQPVMSPRRYSMFCCDCALCHQMQFRIVKARGGKQGVQFRVKRANLYTQMKRAHKSESHRVTFLKKGERVVALIDNAMVITVKNALYRGVGKKLKRKRRG